MAGASTSIKTRPAATAEAASVERYFQVSLFLLVTTGFVTLAGTGRLDLFSIAGVSMALGIRAILLLRNHTVLIPERWTSLATLGYLVFFAVDLVFLSGSYVSASVHLVLFTIVVKLFSVQRERDHLYLMVLSFLAVLSAAVLTVDTVFFALFCVFLLIAVNTFLSMEMRRSLRSLGSEVRPAGSLEERSAGTTAMSAAAAVGFAPLSRALSGTGFLLSAVTMALSLGLFFMLPRLSAGYLSSYSPHNQFVSGFSESVQLGEIGRIQQSNTIVMHVELDNPDGTPAQGPDPSALDLKWRGVALTHFDGRIWSNPLHQSMEVALANDGRFDLWRRPSRGKPRRPPRSAVSFSTLPGGDGTGGHECPVSGSGRRPAAGAHPPDRNRQHWRRFSTSTIA